MADLQSLEPAADKTVHFLHIGKCAGTQIANVLRQLAACGAPRSFLKHPHQITLRDLPKPADYFFSIRDPISRFRSGFYSRKRKGMPRHFGEWSFHEREAFTQFPEANDLAESLFAPGVLGHQAVAAMSSIGHISRNQLDWFAGQGHMLKLRPPLWIIRQEHFAVDLPRFLQAAGLAEYATAVTISEDLHGRHGNDYSATPALSEHAKANLARWYVQDLQFYASCEAWLAAQELRM